MDAEKNSIDLPALMAAVEKTKAEHLQAVEDLNRARSVANRLETFRSNAELRLGQALRQLYGKKIGDFYLLKDAEVRKEFEETAPRNLESRS
jgi:hypothetical protein